MLQSQTRALLVQVAVGLVVASCAISSGMSLGFSAIAEEQLKDGVDNFTDGQISWFASVASVGTPLGCLASGPLLDAGGRRAALLALNAPFLLGWVLLATAPAGAALQMYIGRLLTGMATGMASVPATVYLGEMAQARWRGVFVTWTSIAISVGILAAYLLGTAFRQHWRWAAWACAVVPAAALPLVFLLVPESPPWLSQRGRPEAAEASLRRLRGVPARPAPLPPSLATEVAALPPPPPKQPAVDAHAPAASCCAGPRSALSALARPEAWKPVIIMNGFFLFQQITGIYVVVAYAVRIVEKAGVEFDAYLSAVVLGAVQVVAGAGASAVLSRCPRRTLAAIAGVAQTLPLLALGLYLQLGDGDASWLPLTAMIVYVVAGAFGLHTLPWAMLGEVFPVRVRGVAAALTTCLAYLYNFGMLKAYPSLERASENASASGTSELLFYGFAVTSALSVAFVLLWLPETHGRTAQEIEAAFAGRPPSPAPATDPTPTPATDPAPEGDEPTKAKDPC